VSKQQLTDLTTRLREAAQLQDYAAKAAIDLIRLSSDRAKESLVAAEGDDMLRAQGEARAFERLLRELTVTPPSIS